MADSDAHESGIDVGTEDVIVDEGEDADETSVDVDVDTETLETETATEEPASEDPELEAIKQRVKEMEEEAEKLKEMQSQVEKQMMSPTATTPGTGTGFPTMEEKLEADARSVHVSNVDYGATAEELEGHFHGCGAINRITILCDKWTGHPKGFAYIEFADKDAVQTAVGLDESLFRGRQIKVAAKRTNRPGVSSTNRGRRFRRSGYRPSYGGYYVPRPRRFRRRSAVWYSPY